MASGLVTTAQDSFVELTRQARKRLLEMHYKAKTGHIGGNLSCLDLLLGLYHRAMNRDDQFILSKGHAAGALYVTLWTLGLVNDDDLDQFHRDGTRFSGHPPARGIPEVLFATGSLGHGLGLAAGLALGKQLQGARGRVFCLTSDGEWNEGSCWESLIFASHRRLDNLCILVDLNGLQGFGTTREVANLDSMVEKFHTFGIETQLIDGHDPQAIHEALLKDIPGPQAIVAVTCKGYGVSFMEDQMDWHYRQLSEPLYHRALREI